MADATEEFFGRLAERELLSGTGCANRVRRRQAVGHPPPLGLRRHLRRPGHPQPRRAAVDLTIRVDAASDFAHIFEVKNASTKRGRLYTRVEPGHLLLGYERETFRRETVIYRWGRTDAFGRGRIDVTVGRGPSAR